MFENQIEELLKKMEEYSGSHENAWSIPKREAEFIYLFLRAYKPNRILEVGTSTGYSTIYFALAVKEIGGIVDTIEMDPEKIKIAKENFKVANLEEIISILEGDANRILNELKERYDFAFLDGEKKEYLSHFKMIKPKLGKNAIVMADNAGDLAEEMKDYLEFVRNTDGLLSVFVPIGNGLEMTQVLK